MATPSARGLTPAAPEKGVFPLDHFGECKSTMAAYTACLRDAGGATERCKHLSKKYLECRMSKCVCLSAGGRVCRSALPAESYD